jgi:hypothetical protein
MKGFSISISLLALMSCLFSCSDERQVSNTIYLKVVAKDIGLAEKISKLILDDMNRFECVIPRDWNIKLDKKPCSRIVKFDPNKKKGFKFRRIRPDMINKITILDGKKYRIDRQRFNGDVFVHSYSSSIMSLGLDEEPNAVNFAKKIITSPFYMIGYKK